MLVNPFFRSNYKEPIQKVPKREANDIVFDEYQTIHNKYPLVSENIVY